MTAAAKPALIPALNPGLPIATAAGAPSPQFAAYWREVITSIQGAIATLQAQESALAAQQAQLEQTVATLTATTSTANGAAAFISGISTTAVPEGSNLYFTTARAQSAVSAELSYAPHVDAPVTGFVTLNDAGGTARKLAIIS